jgi:hypothetical protein
MALFEPLQLWSNLEVAIFICCCDMEFSIVLVNMLRKLEMYAAGAAVPCLHGQAGLRSTALVEGPHGAATGAPP